MIELDNLDVKILAHLQSNSRESFQEIAKRCLTSVPTVKSSGGYAADSCYTGKDKSY
ncbi:MAG: AsnC family protein [Candidatus Methanoperedens sp.]|nr:AsnC family protein [Candidatus Methanoperedens sp.]CAG1008746.1 hypothetical protein METP1_03632 [Methanosarcinales archaeon]